MAKKRFTQWLTIERDGVRHLYQLSVIDASALGDYEEPKCPECGEQVKPEFDTIQFGFWDTQFQTVFTCEPCGRAYRCDYVVQASDFQMDTAKEGTDSHD